jgi:hypothetical protein
VPPIEYPEPAASGHLHPTNIGIFIAGVLSRKLLIHSRPKQKLQRNPVAEIDDGTLEISPA